MENEVNKIFKIDRWHIQITMSEPYYREKSILYNY